jgi:hypothetical protein
VVGAGARALVFLDVDGTLMSIGSGLGGEAGRPVTARLRAAARSNPMLERLDTRHGAWLSALPADLVWATSWMGDANDVVGPLLDLPELPVVRWSGDENEDETGQVHWKTRDLVARAAVRPFVWVDDEITDADRVWVGAHHPGRALLHQVDPRRGLTREDITVIHEWLDRL